MDGARPHDHQQPRVPLFRIALMASRPRTTVAFVASVMGNADFNARGGESRTISLTCKFCVGNIAPL